jgi:hypothetical protein
VNQFVETPVGKLTAALIVWNYMGNMVVHVVSGWVLLAISWGLLFWYSKRLNRVYIEYDVSSGRNWLGRYPIKSIKKDEMSENNIMALIIGYVASGIVSLFVMFTGW